MNLRHPDETALATYAAGTMRPGFDLVVAAHLEGCPHCRRAVRGFEAAAGTLFCAPTEAEMEPGSLGAAMARLDGLEQAPPSPPLSIIDRLPLGPRRWLAPGAWSAPVKVPHAREDRVYLLHVGPGMQTLKHGHRGPEFACILSGSLTDEGVRYVPGDFMARDTEHNHQPMVDADAPCVCLFATQGRLKVDDWIGRLVQFIADV